ncbi:hypothetical protein ACSNOK_31175 [Streptomyces sp. URMC 126]|uniref:MmyB family transcriptional regulator n=1 Tax=Streptomyces sp. URMC 126 TaxID=3423401 RepID=UPI003F1D291B
MSRNSVDEQHRQRGNGKERVGGAKTPDRPKAGRVTLTYEIMPLAATDGQRLVVYQAEPGSADEASMLLLDPEGGNRSAGGTTRPEVPAEPAARV